MSDSQIELEQAHALFNYKLTVPPPFERDIFEIEITGHYLGNLEAAQMALAQLSKP
ncbi:hypothetical protein ACYZTM_04235 [Pseudomonas sp. MDT2-39-1]